MEKLCPKGWHVPSIVDWNLLIGHLGNESVAGGKLKEINTTHWNSPNTDATNESGFTAFPGGVRSINSPQFMGLGDFSFIRSSTELNNDSGFYEILFYNNGSISQSWDWKQDGISVRCLKDN